MSVKEYVKRNWNIPNALTLLRVFLVPVYIALFALGRKYAALFTFLFACLTDFLDGQIARRCNLITDFGKLMDPLADKVMVLTAMFSMTIGNRYIAPVIPWSAVIILLFKEIVMVVGGIALLRHGVVVFSSLIGKVAHCVFIGSLVAVYFHDELRALIPGAAPPLDLCLVWIAVALTLCAMVFYVTGSIRNARQQGLIAGKGASIPKEE